MRTGVCLAIALLTAIPGCGGNADTAAAMATVAAFQTALQQHDTEACRLMLTTESAAAIDAMPWDRIASRQPLKVLAATANQGEFRVQVQDPDDGGRTAEFVVVREYGRLVVDLVATAGLTAETVEASGSREQFVPRELTPADFDRLRQHELAQPPR